MTKQPPEDAGPEARLRTMRILWVVFLTCVGLFLLFTRVYRQGEGAAGDAADGGVPPLLYAFAAAGLAAVVASFVLKAGFYRRAAEQRQPALLQTGFIIALALCEAAVLMGVVGVLVTRCDYAYLLFGLGALGEALHFPRREQVLAAYHKPVG